MSFIPDRTQAFVPLGQALAQAARELYTALRGFLSLHDNMKVLEVTHTFGVTPDTSEDVDLTALGIAWTPTRVLTLEVNDGAVVYAATTAHTGWTSTTVKMKSSKANTIWIGTVY